MKYVLIGLLKVWRIVVSPLYGNVCRYYPSCSAYALRAVEHHGAVRGSWYAARRVLRCHPWAPGGYDPVRGTPEFDEEMRVQQAAAVTMDTGSVVDAAAQVTQGGRGAGTTTTHPPHESRRHQHLTQGRATTVAQRRGPR
ncbi:MAG: membrane protein insertion efficiency factor YidD [Janthinobacterium lividum]